MVISKVFTLFMSAISSSPSPVPAGSRRAILGLIKTRGPATAVALAQRLKITAMAVRQHLYALQEQRLVSFKETVTGVGRPRKIWGLTEAAERYFPDAHAELAVSLLDLVRQSFGSAGLDKLMAERATQQVKLYRQQLKGRSTLGERVRALARQRSDEGYMAEAKREKDGWLLIENHCPVCSAAKTCAGLCQTELDVFQAVLGGDVVIERSEHMLSDSRRCVYRIQLR